MKKSEFKSIISEAVVETFSTPSFRNELKKIIMEVLEDQPQNIQSKPPIDKNKTEEFRNHLREQYGSMMMGGDDIFNFDSNSIPATQSPIPSDGSLPSGEVPLNFINNLMNMK